MAISIPDDIFEGAERLAKHTKKSRSRLFSDAVREYLARHGSEEVTDAMNRVCAELESSGGNITLRDKFTAAAARRTLKHIEW